MNDPMRMLVDTNVWAYFFLKSEPYYEETCDFILGAQDIAVDLLYTPTSAKDLFYIVPRQLRAEAQAAGDEVANASFVPVAWACIRTLSELATAAPQSAAECELAWMLRTKHNDFEDNLVVAAAETCDADFIVTYDKKLIEHIGPACITPAQAKALIDLKSLKS